MAPTLLSDTELLRGIANNVSAMLAYWDADLRCRFANDAYKRWFGVTPKSLVGTHIQDLLGPKLFELNRPYIEGALRGEPQEFEREIPDPAGGPSRHSLANYIPDVADGTVRGFYVMVSDISEVKRTQLALAASEAKLRVLAETGATLAASLDFKETLKTLAVEIVTRMADICVVDILSADGKTLERLTVAHAAADKARLTNELTHLHLDPRHTLGRDVFATGEPHIYEDMDLAFYRSVIEDEQHLRVLQALGPRSAMAVPLVHGGLIGALIFGSEQRRRYSAADLPLATELARRASSAISNARLYEAEQRATRVRDEVLSVVAHDLRSPLNSIYLGAQLLEHEVAKLASSRAREEVQSIIRSTMWANRLIQDLLDVARIEGGGLVITPANVSPRAIIDEVMKMQRLVASAAGITLRSEIANDVQNVWADRDRLIQVLENLVGNALKFTAPGGRVTIAVTNEGEFVQFAVSDTGAGIPEANLERVFDRFWQANRTERRGAGLGLPICKGIIEKHGGRIWGTSSVGLGTTFDFTVPAIAAATQAMSEAV